MIRRPPRSTQSRSSAASDVYKRQLWHLVTNHFRMPLHRSGDASFCAGGRFMRKRTEIAATEGSVRSYLRSHLGIHVRGDPRDAINKLRVSAAEGNAEAQDMLGYCLLYTSPSPRDR